MSGGPYFLAECGVRLKMWRNVSGANNLCGMSQACLKELECVPALKLERNVFQFLKKAGMFFRPYKVQECLVFHSLKTDGMCQGLLKATECF